MSPPRNQVVSRGTDVRILLPPAQSQANSGSEKTAQWCRPRGAGDPNPKWLGRHGVNATLADSELKDLRLESWKVLFFTETQHRPAFSSPRLNPGSASSKKAGAEPLARHRRGTRVANPRQGDFAKPDCEIGQASVRRLARAKTRCLNKRFPKPKMQSVRATGGIEALRNGTGR